jgi:hypothetical protein
MPLKYFYQYDAEHLIVSKKYKELYALMASNNQLSNMQSCNTDCYCKNKTNSYKTVIVQN